MGLLWGDLKSSFLAIWSNSDLFLNLVCTKLVQECCLSSVFLGMLGWLFSEFFLTFFWKVNLAVLSWFLKVYRLADLNGYFKIKSFFTLTKFFGGAIWPGCPFASRPTGSYSGISAGAPRARRFATPGAFSGCSVARSWNRGFRCSNAWWRARGSRWAWSASSGTSPSAGSRFWGAAWGRPRGFLTKIKN